MKIYKNELSKTNKQKLPTIYKSLYQSFMSKKSESGRRQIKIYEFKG